MPYLALALALGAILFAGCWTATTPVPQATIVATAVPAATPTGVVLGPTPAATSTAAPTPAPTRTPAGVAVATAVPVATAPARTTAPPAVLPPAAAGSPEQTIADALAAERPLRDLADLAIRLKGLPPAAATPAAQPRPPEYQVGRQDSFWVSDQKAKTYFTMTATLAHVSPHAYFYIQDGMRFSADAWRQAAEAFETKSYPIVRRYFGPEQPGVDGDPRVTVLNGNIPGVGGYFSSDDQYPRSVSPHSNERNIVYINTTVGGPGTRSYDATLAHEFQHLVSWNIDRESDTWFNEGSSELAMRLTGASTGGIETAYANDPNTQLTAWSDDNEQPGKTGAHYAAGYLFLSYFLEQYGGNEALPELLAQPGRGTQPFDHYLAKKGYSARFDDVFRDWVVANYLDDRRLGGGRYWHKDIDLHARAERVDAYPAQRRGTIEQYGARYFELAPGQGDVTIYFTGTTTSKLLDNTAKSGRNQWWSHRGDMMNTSLTREFDLSGLSKATLRFATWFHIEEDYDYAYVEVSSDGGRTWATLAGRHTTTDDPIGHNLGNAYTGKSGGGRTAQWVEEEIDLTPYAGGRIQLRFEHVTDDAYNAPGFAVDDISIPELGFRDDAEVGDNGWRAVGFVRTANVIPQRYSVQLIAVGEPGLVETLPVDADGHGQLTTKGLGREYRRMVLVIAPMAQVTTEVAPFQLSIAQGP